MSNRRQFVAAALACSTVPQAHAYAQVATPQATPVATAPTTAEILPAWQDAMEAMRALGRRAIDALFDQDAEALVALSNPDVAAAIASPNVLQESIDLFTRDQVRFHFADVDAWFYARFTPEALTGFYYQGGAFAFQALPASAQTAARPMGTWRGVVMVGTDTVDLELEFGDDQGDLTVALTIAAQGIVEVPMSQVQAPIDVPIGDRINERALPIGGDRVSTNSYSAEYAWGDHALVVSSGWDTEMRMIGLMLTPQPPLPPLPDHTPITCRLPFDGAWLAYWAGDSVFANYHAAVPTQRTALDLMIWNNGATSHGDGTRPEDYWCFGQPLVSPVSGTVVEAVDRYEDIAPQTLPNTADHPAGNHIIIETGNGFILLAHCQQGSVRVTVGDTVSPGDQLALVGNSGNTSEPHVHMHGQSTVDFFDPTAVAIPILFEHLMVDGEQHSGPIALRHSTIVEHIGWR